MNEALPRVMPVSQVVGYDPAWGSDFIYVTLHRAELVDDPQKLEQVFAALHRLPLPVLFAAHPRTAAALERGNVRINGRVTIRPPLGYLESLAVLRERGSRGHRFGGMQREAYWLGVPCVTVRSESEWVETVGTAARIVWSHRRVSTVSRTPSSQRSSRPRNWDRGAYGDGTAAERVAEILAAS